MGTGQPQETYQARIEAMQRVVDSLSVLDRHLSNARLFLFLAGVSAGLLGHFTGWFLVYWALIPFALFLATVVYHAGVLRRLGDARETISYYEAGLDRIHDRWMGRGETGEAYAPEGHLYEGDLDVFGEGSLFQLLNTTRTKSGASTLASWLCEPADVDVIAARQEAVEELRGRLDLREQIALAGRDIQSELHPLRLGNWAREELVELSGARRVLPIVLTAVPLTCIAIMIAIMVFWKTGLFYLPFMMAFMVNIVVLRWYRPWVESVTSGLYGAVRDLELFEGLAEVFEGEQFDSELLKRHRARLVSGEESASVAIRRLSNLYTWFEAHKNQMFVPIEIVLLWSVHCAIRIEGWRRRHGGQVSDWMESLAEIEALCALSAYAYEHPADPFPEFVEEEGPRIVGRDMGHPLLASADCIRNSIELTKSCGLLIVSGSNMSGKSTYLRTIGVNLVLAMAGAPVRCASLVLTPCRVGASIQVRDSIQSGVSHFYAEILRLKALVELAEGEMPLVFLIDEILHGTNSNDRRIGAEAVVDQLLKLGAVGLVTTHDLALTKLETGHGARIANVHFQDALDGDKLVFDYQVRKGVVEKSNALDLMRGIGLKIGKADSGSTRS
jgi:hypothetical protein